MGLDREAMVDHEGKRLKIMPKMMKSLSVDDDNKKIPSPFLRFRINRINTIK